MCGTLKIRVCGTIISRITKWKGLRDGAFFTAVKTGEHPCHDGDRAGQFECASGSFQQRELCLCVFAVTTSVVSAQRQVWCGRRSPQWCGEMCARRPPRQASLACALNHCSLSAIIQNFATVLSHTLKSECVGQHACGDEKGQ